jgi:hypothetical protein
MAQVLGFRILLLYWGSGLSFLCPHFLYKDGGSRGDVGGGEDGGGWGRWGRWGKVGKVEIGVCTTLEK